MADNKDFNITPPVKEQNTQPQQQPQQPSSGEQILPPPGAEELAKPAISQNGAILGTAIILVLAILFFFVRQAVRTHLIANKAPLSAAGNAGWAMFAFLMAIAITAVFGIIGNLWLVLPFIIPMAVLDLVTMILAIVLFVSASKK
jgi:hypothetical protein